MIMNNTSLKKPQNSKHTIENDDQLKQEWLQFKLHSVDKHANVND